MSFIRKLSQYLETCELIVLPELKKNPSEMKVYNLNKVYAHFYEVF